MRYFASPVAVDLLIRELSQLGYLGISMKNQKTFVARLLLGCLSVFVPCARAQTPGYPVELVDSAGNVYGKVVINGQQLVFSSDTRPDLGFSAPVSAIQSLSVDGGNLNIQLKQPVVGQQGRVILHVADDASRTAVMHWYQTAAQQPGVVVVTPQTGQASNFPTYTVKHKEVGSDSHGRLVITDVALAYESIDHPKDSKRWDFSQVKKLKMEDDSHKLEVEPFDGDQYTFEFDGSKMSKADYQGLIDRVAQARAVAPRR